MLNMDIVKYTLLAARRDKLIVSMLVTIVVGACLSVFFGSSAVIEKDYFTVVFVSASLRIVSVIGLVLFVIFFIRRSFDGKDIEFLLSRPVGRVQLVLSYFVAFSLLCVFMGVAVGLCVYAVSPHLFSNAYLIWTLSIVVECIIMAGVALFFSMYISSAASAAMATLGFYAFGRMTGQLIGIIDSPLVDDYGFLSIILQIISMIVPRLDLLGQSSWLIYGIPDTGFGFIHVVLQGAVFCFLILSATCFDFLKRAF